MFISNDHKFSLSRIIHLFYQRLISSASNSLKSSPSGPSYSATQAHSAEDDDLKSVDSVLHECLSRLWLLRCKDPLQLRVSLAALPRRLATIEKRKQQEQVPQTSDPPPAAEVNVTLIIDSIDTFSLVENKSTYHYEPVRLTTC